MDHAEPQAQKAFVAFFVQWWRLLAMIVITVIGLGGAYHIIADENPSRWLVAFSGLLGLLGGFCALCLISFIYVTVAEDLRPALLFRKPHTPAYLAHRQAALVGRISLRNHPIRFWGGLAFNRRFFFGFMIFEEPEYLDFADPDCSGDKSAA